MREQGVLARLKLEIERHGMGVRGCRVAGAEGVQEQGEIKGLAPLSAALSEHGEALAHLLGLGRLQDVRVLHDAEAVLALFHGDLAVVARVSSRNGLNELLHDWHAALEGA